MENRDYIPLIFEQQGLREFSRDTRSGVMNLAVRVELTDIDEERFLSAMRIGVQRLPYCSFRLHTMEDGSFMQYKSSDPPEEMDRTFDLSDLSEARVTRRLTEWAAAPFPNELMDVQLTRLRLVRLKEGRHLLFACVHHYIADIYGLIFLLTYIDRVYAALSDGTELPPEGADPVEVIHQVNAYHASEKYKKEEEWFRQQFATEPVFTSINGVYSPEFIHGKNYGKGLGLTQHRSGAVTRTIPSGLAESIIRYAAEHGASPYALISAATSVYLGSVSKTDDVTVSLRSTSRATAKEKSSGLSRGKGLMLRTVIRGEESFADLVKGVSLTQMGCYRRRSLYTDRLLSEMYETNGGLYYSVSLSFLPFMDYASFRTCLDASVIDNGIALEPLFVIVMPSPAGGSMDCIYKYAKNYIKPKSIEKFHTFLLRFLEAGIQNPYATVRDLTDACM